MSTAARIDELSKKFEENPRRYFAPLANELRKAGDLVQAIALCREHLPKQPGHMSGYIVFGQALYESGALDEARSVFEQALALDPENLIALRHLGDIAKAHGDTAAARRWYERVLDADPRNDDIALQLAALAALPGPVPVRPTPIVSPALVTPPIPMHAIGLGALPTPDSALRAVDFDVVNARIAHYTPLDLDAIESVGASAPVEPPSFQAPRFGTPHDVPAIASDAWHEVALPPAPRPPTPLDSAAIGGSAGEGAPAYGTPTDGTPASGALSHETPAFGAASFATKQTPTPAVGAPATAAADVHDALGAFAAHDPSDEMQGDDFRARSTPARSPTIEASALSEAAFESPQVGEPPAPFEEAFEEGIMAPEWPVTGDLLARVSAPRSITPQTVEITPDAVEAFGREAHDPEPFAAAIDATFEDAVVDHDDFVVTSEALTPFATEIDTAQDVEAIDAAGPVDAVHAFEVPTVANAPVVSWYDAPDATAIATTETTDLPWLAAPEAVDEETAAEAERELEEIADAFASDARAAGDDADVLVTRVESTDGADAAVSFSDVLNPNHESDDDRAEEEAEEAEEADEATAHSNDSPAFVTETMAELLVSQGFIGRAATVYEELVRRHPYDPVLTSRLAELRDQLAGEAADGPAVPDSPTPASFVAIPTPVEGTPSFLTPSFGTPAFGTHEFRMSALSEAASPTPAFPAAAFPTPAYPTPAFHTPAFSAASTGASLTTARERFALLAARRVPRRTPPLPTAIVEEQLEGLSSLFGEHAVTTSGDDAAARALADAFAPISEADAASGAMLDFGDSESDSDIGSGAVTNAQQNPVASPRLTPPVTDANAGFSFDRFFPDPATQSAPPTDAEKTPDPAAPVGDDLAQFSAWLKGLGTT